jgi:O-antigen/teichoic acid export membrane protein
LTKQLPLSDIAVPVTETGSGWRHRVRDVNVWASLRKSLTRPSRLVGVFASLVGSQVGSALLGLVFWTVAAREFTPEEVGVGAALVAAMTLLSVFGVLGIGTLLLERFKVVSVTGRRALYTTGLGIAAMGGALVAAGWLGLSALVHLSGALGDLSVGTALLVVGATSIAAMCIAFDQAAIGMGASAFQLRRNLLASVLRIAALTGAIELNIASGPAILVSWTVGLAGSLLATPLRRHLSPPVRMTAKQRWHLVQNHWTAAIGHHGLTLAMASSSLMLPVVVASIMPATPTAYFAQARLLADTGLVLPYYLTIALFATAQGSEGFRQKAPRTLVIGTVLALSLVLGAALFGRVVLEIFGTSYAQASPPLLLLLLAAGPAHLVKDHFVVLRRLQGMRMHGALTMGLWTAAELAGAVAGGLAGGITMLCLGWLAMSTACAVIALPVVLSAIRRQPNDTAHSGPADEGMMATLRRPGPAFLPRSLRGVPETQRLSPADAQMYWASAKMPSDQFLLYAFAGEPDDIEAAVAEVLRHARSCADLRLRVEEGGVLRYPSWIASDVDVTQIVVRAEDLGWQQCLDALAKLFDHQLDLRRMGWRLHVFTPVYGVPGTTGPAIVAVLQIGHALADGQRSAALAGVLFGRRATVPAVNPFRPRNRVLCSVEAVRMHRQLERDTAAGLVPAPAPLRRALSTNNRPTGGIALRTLVRHRSELPDTTVTVGVLAAVSAALSGYLSARFEDASALGSEVLMAKPVVPHTRNRFDVVGVGLHPGAASADERVRLIAGELADRRRRCQYPAFAAGDRAQAAVPSLLLRWGIARFDCDARSPTVIGNTVMSSVNRGRDDLSFGGCPVTLTAGYPALSPMMGLTHGVHGIGDTVAVSVHAAESSVADLDDYMDRLDIALRRR